MHLQKEERPQLTQTKRLQEKEDCCTDIVSLEGANGADHALIYMMTFRKFSPEMSVAGDMPGVHLDVTSHNEPVLYRSHIVQGLDQDNLLFLKVCTIDPVPSAFTFITPSRIHIVQVANSLTNNCILVSIRV